jgi:hypothetical protein
MLVKDRLTDVTPVQPIEVSPVFASYSVLRVVWEFDIDTVGLVGLLVNDDFSAWNVR